MRARKISWWFLFKIILAIFCICCLDRVKGDNGNSSKPDDDVETKWISELLFEGKNKFRMDEMANTKCKRDFDLYQLHLRNQSIWALRMMESSEWPHGSIYSGVTYRLGNWYECLLVSEYDVAGQYCWATLDYDTGRHRISNSSLEWPDERASAWNALEKFKSLPWRANRQHLTWALCLPASCQTKEIENSLNETLYPIFYEHGFDISVKVDPRHCSTKKIRPLTPGFFIVSGFIIIVITLSLLCSIIDSKNSTEDNPKSKNKSLGSYLVKSLSVVQNYKNLTHSAGKYAAQIDFIKIFNMICIIQGHRYIFSEGYPKFPVERIEKETYGHDSVALSLRGNLIVDTFFMFSGFLTFHFGYEHMRKSGIAYLIQSIIIRWAKMVPVFIVLMLFIIHILPFLNEGPQWDFRVGTEVYNCRYTFWQNVFAVSNIFNADKMCLYTSWYVSVDIQLTILGSILVFIMAKNEKLGMFLTSVAFLVGSIATCVLVYVKNYHALIISYMSVLTEPRNSEEFTKYYIYPFARLAPYLIGIVAAILTKIKKEKNYSFTEKQVAVLGILCIVMKFALFDYTKLLFDFVTEYNPLKQAIAAVVVRSLFVIPEAFLQCLCFTNNIVGFGKILRLQLWIPLGRLLYCVFLVHVPIQLYHAAASHVLEPTFSLSDHTWLVVSDISFSFLAAFLLHLFIEAPVVNLTKLTLMILLSPRKREAKTSGEKVSCENKSFEKNEDSNNVALSKV